MKKLIAIIGILAVTGQVCAQQETGNKTGNSSGLKEGTNTVLLKEGKGLLQFVKSGDAFSNVIYKDAAGKSIRLVPTGGGTNGAPKPECKTKLPDACFSSPDKNVGMCICKPGDISIGYTISFVRKPSDPVEYIVVGSGAGGGPLAGHSEGKTTVGQ